MRSLRTETCRATPLDSATPWIVDVNKSVEHMPSDEQQYWKKRSIYKLPACITNLNRKAYWPQAASFGPYHHGEHHLRPMEEHKHRALLHFLRRSGKGLGPFVESLKEVAEDLKANYGSLDRKWKDDGSIGGADKFLQLMITDGCFMLEILRTMAGEEANYASNDPIFGDFGYLYIIPFVKRDMLMLENQLPKLVLDRLVAVERDSSQEDEYTNKLIIKFFFPDKKIKTMGKCLHVLDVFRKSLLLLENTTQQEQPTLVKCLHVLDVFRKSLLLHENTTQQAQPTQDEDQARGGQPNQDKRRGDEDEIIPSATELEEAGIQLKRSETGRLKDIKFAGGALHLPAIVVDDPTESAFLNLMTFERFHHGVGDHEARDHEAGDEVTAYIIFLDDIIDNEQDVALLSSQGIIKNLMGSNKAVARLFNLLNKDITLDTNNSLSAVRKEVSNYCKKPWNKWRGIFIKTYVRSPWTLLSLIAAITFFILAIIQTIYIVRPDA